MRKYVCAASAAALALTLFVPCAALADEAATGGDDPAAEAPAFTPYFKTDGSGVPTAYYAEEGVASTGLFTAADGYSYYANAKGRIQTGWVLKGKKLRYFSPKTARMVTGKTVRNIKLASNGIAKESACRSAKIICMKIVAKVTKSSWSKKKKLKAVWNYATSSRFHYISGYPSFEGKDWPQRALIKFYKRGGGCCYHYACMFAGLAREVGYTDVVVARGRCLARPGVNHGWTIINDKHYDPERQNVYGVTVYKAKKSSWRTTQDYRTKYM